MLAAAAAILFLFRTPTPGDGFAARGGLDHAGGDVESVAAGSPLHVYRVPSKEQGGSPIPASEGLESRTELAFAYENRDRKKYLMIFGVNEAGRVYWFYPGWKNPTDNPSAVAITETPGLHELPDAVVHRFEGLRLDIHGLFLDEPLTVRDVESALTKGTLAAPGRVDHVEHFKVVP